MIKESSVFKMKAITLVLVILMTKLHVRGLPMYQLGEALKIANVGDGLNVGRGGDGLDAVKTVNAHNIAQSAGAPKAAETVDTVQALRATDTPKAGKTVDAGQPLTTADPLRKVENPGGFDYQHDVHLTTSSGGKLVSSFSISRPGISPHDAKIVTNAENIRTQTVGMFAHEFPSLQFKGVIPPRIPEEAKVTNPAKTLTSDPTVPKVPAEEISVLGAKSVPNPTTSDGVAKVLNTEKGTIARPAEQSISPQTSQWMRFKDAVLRNPFQTNSRPSVTQDVKATNQASGATPKLESTADVTVAEKPVTATSFLGNLGTSTKNRLYKVMGSVRGTSEKPTQSLTLEGDTLATSVSKKPTDSPTSYSSSWISRLPGLRSNLQPSVAQGVDKTVDQSTSAPRYGIPYFKTMWKPNPSVAQDTNKVADPSTSASRSWRSSLTPWKSKPLVAADVNKAVDQTTSAESFWRPALWRGRSQPSGPKTASTSEVTAETPASSPGFWGRVYQPRKFKNFWKKFKGWVGRKSGTSKANEISSGEAITKLSPKVVPATTAGYGQRARKTVGRLGSHLNKIVKPREWIQKSWNKLRSNSPQSEPLAASERRLSRTTSAPLLSS